MQDTEQTVAFRELFSQLDAVDKTLNEGPDESEAPEAFRKRLADQLSDAQQQVTALSDDDIEAEYYEDEGED